MLLIWGEAALAGEKLGLYKPDISFLFFSSFFFFFPLYPFLREFEQTKEWDGKRVLVVVDVGVVIAEEKRRHANTAPSRKRVICNNKKTINKNIRKKLKKK